MKRAILAAVIFAVAAVSLPLSTLAYHRAGRTIVRTNTHVPAPPYYLCLIVLDGARPGYLRTPNIPHVQALVARGTQFPNAWTGILESETPSGHAAISTGSEPRRDGIASFGWVTANNVSVNLFDPAKIRAGAMEKVMLLAGVPTIAGLVHRQNPAAKVVALSGYKYYAADALGGPRADVIMYYASRPGGILAPTFIPGHLPPPEVLTAPDLQGKNLQPLGMGDREAMKLAAATFDRMHQQVTLINLPEFDWPLGHLWGGPLAPHSVTSLMQSFDQDLGTLEESYRRAHVLKRTIFVLTADHGFTPIYRSVPEREIRDAVMAAGTRITRDTYHTGAYLWLHDRSRAAAAAGIIARLHIPYIQSVYYKQLVKGRYQYVNTAAQFLTSGVAEANQYLLHTFLGPNGPDLAVLFTQGAVGSTDAQSTWKGDHGGADWQSQHIPLVISGPGFRRGYVSSYPARLIDIAPTVLSMMDVPHSRMQGLALADAMKAPVAADVSAQHTMGLVLTPLVSALERESRLETAARKRGR